MWTLSERTYKCCMSPLATYKYFTKIVQCYKATNVSLQIWKLPFFFYQQTVDLLTFNLKTNQLFSNTQMSSWVSQKRGSYWNLISNNNTGILIQCTKLFNKCKGRGIKSKDWFQLHRQIILFDSRSRAQSLKAPHLSLHTSLL